MRERQYYILDLGKLAARAETVLHRATLDLHKREIQPRLSADGTQAVWESIAPPPAALIIAGPFDAEECRAWLSKAPAWLDAQPADPRESRG